ncbi:MAG: adenine deaminase [Planctomycetaceae bacterium]|nr:adenine deaminase [Planctomycetaceae bacterium]
MNHPMAAAVGDKPFDLVLKNAQFVNVHTEEIYRADVGIAGGRIAHVTQPEEDGLSALDGGAVYDCANRFLLPGFIDTHVHIESSMMTPANFARTVIPHGTTTVLADPHEICNVLGVEGIDYCAEAARDILLRVFLAVPSCVPSLLGAESNKMVFGPAEIARMLAMPGVLALGEVMDYMGVINRDPRMIAILDEALQAGKMVQGHVIDVTSRQLSAYMAAGVESDHESRTLADAVMKLRAGMTLECRYGSTAQNVPVEAEALALLNYPVNATLCTDDREPDDLLRRGHIDEALRQAVRAGMSPVKAVQLATRNAALFLGQKDIGALRPGARADMVLVNDLHDFTVEAVFIGGRLCAENGRLTAPFPSPALPIESRNTMNIKGALSRDDFTIPAQGDSVRLNGVSLRNGDPFMTKLVQTTFAVRNGCAAVGDGADFVTLAVVERHNATGNVAVAPLRGTGLRRGAIAGTVAHDSHNLFVLGKNPDDMLAAALRLVESGGGFAAAENGRVVAEVPLPVCGLMSVHPVEALAAEMAALKRTVNDMGIVGGSPVHMLTWFCLPVLPEVRLTDKGLFDTVRQKPLPLYVPAE